MNQLDAIREQIRMLFTTNPNIHVDISIRHPKLSLENDPAVITAVYPRVFCLEEYSDGIPHHHTLQYADVLTRQIVIRELEGTAQEL